MIALSLGMPKVAKQLVDPRLELLNLFMQRHDVEGKVASAQSKCAVSRNWINARPSRPLKRGAFIGISSMAAEESIARCSQPARRSIKRRAGPYREWRG